MGVGVAGGGDCSTSVEMAVLRDLDGDVPDSESHGES